MTNEHNTVEVNAQLQWVFYRDEPSRRWIGVCDALKLTVEGETHADLRENIEDTLDLLMLNLLQENELDRFLTQHGWSLEKRPPFDSQDVQFDVPFELIARQANRSARSIH